MPKTNAEKCRAFREKIKNTAVAKKSTERVRRFRARQNALSILQNSENPSSNYEFDESISAEEREFYLKAYPMPDNVRFHYTHCTTCKMHLGTAPGNADNIRMHPILRVTHCPKCQDFYNSGEFSKGEDGLELYCRWCGQGGEVYCCSNCPFVFCKSCITKNLSHDVVADIEQNENWRCFACEPKILWPLRAVHWALINYIEKQKKEIEAMNLSEEEKNLELHKDRSNCCRLTKAKCGNMSDSMDSIDSALSKRSQSSSSATKKKLPALSSQKPAAKRPKTNNEVVCTPETLSMLEPPLIQARSPSVQLRPLSSNTINGFRIDLNSGSQQSAPTAAATADNTNVLPSPVNSWPQRATPVQGPVQCFPVSPALVTPLQHQQQQRSFATVQQLTTAPTLRYTSGMVGSTVISSYTQNGPQIQMVNGGVNVVNASAAATPSAPAPAPASNQAVQIRPVMVRHTFPNSAYGVARTQFQDQIFNAMDICQHLSGKIQALTNSNAYKTAKNYLELKELYIHMSYLLAYAIGRFKGLQDKCLCDMRQLGFGTDADSLQNGQLAADKQASDNEDDEIEIVEPKTDTINLDSDDDDTPPTPATTPKQQQQQQKQQIQKINLNIPAKISKVQENNDSTQQDSLLAPMGSVPQDDDLSTGVDMNDFMSTAHSLLASMLEVDIIEGDTELTTGDGSGGKQQKKQPRKKITNKPNPTLLKQKRLLERQKMDEMIRNDAKLKLECKVNVTRLDKEYPEYLEKLTALQKLRKVWHEEQARKAEAQIAAAAKAAAEFLANGGNETTTAEKISEHEQELPEETTVNHVNIVAAVGLIENVKSNEVRKSVPDDKERNEESQAAVDDEALTKNVKPTEEVNETAIVEEKPTVVSKETNEAEAEKLDLATKIISENESVEPVTVEMETETKATVDANPKPTVVAEKMDLDEQVATESPSKESSDTASINETPALESTNSSQPPPADKMETAEAVAETEAPLEKVEETAKPIAPPTVEQQTNNELATNVEKPAEVLLPLNDSKKDSNSTPKSSYSADNVAVDDDVADVAEACLEKAIEQTTKAIEVSEMHTPMDVLDELCEKMDVDVEPSNLPLELPDLPLADSSVFELQANTTAIAADTALAAAAAAAPMTQTDTVSNIN